MERVPRFSPELLSIVCTSIMSGEWGSRRFSGSTDTVHDTGEVRGIWDVQNENMWQVSGLEVGRRG